MKNECAQQMRNSVRRRRHLRRLKKLSKLVAQGRGAIAPATGVNVPDAGASNGGLCRGTFFFAAVSQVLQKVEVDARVLKCLEKEMTAKSRPSGMPDSLHLMKTSAGRSRHRW